MAIQNKIGKFLLSLIEPTTRYVKEEQKKLKTKKGKKEAALKSLLGPLQILASKQGRKSAANIASFMVPFGKGASVASKALAPGAVSGGLFASSQEDATPSSVVGGATIGGATAGVLDRVLPGIGKLLTKLGRGARGSTVAPKVFASPTSQLQKNELIKAAEKFKLKGNATQKLEQLGGIYNALKTNLDDAIRGVTKKFDGTKLGAKALNKAKLKTDITKGVAKTNTDFWSQKLLGVSTADDLAKLKFELMGELGNAFKKVQKGNPLSASEKVMMAYHNVVDDALKSSSKAVSSILKDMSTTHKLAPGLLKASEKSSSLRPLGVPTGISLNKPLQWATDASGRRLQEIGGGAEAITKLLGPINKATKQAQIPAVLKALSGRGQAGEQPAEGIQPAQPTQQGLPKQGDLSPEGQWMWDDASRDWVANDQAGGQAGGDMDTVKQALQIAMLQDLQTGGKNISELNTILTAISATDDEGTQTEREKSNLAKSGVRNLAKVESILTKDPSILTKQLIPGKFASREFDAAMYDAIDSLLKLRTGATSNEQEIRGYMGSIAPKFGDSPKAAQAKLEQIKADFASYIQ